MVKLRNILVVVMSVFIAVAHGISRAHKKLEAKSCECAHTGNGGSVECIFILGMSMELEGLHLSAHARTCRYKDGRSTWNIALGTGNKMRMIKRRCVMCFKCLPGGMECLRLPRGTACPREMPPINAIHKEK
ncbi:hypothetical protein NP493_464g02002 [Ridgeia piscesae]|uniref:Secreted protein n=1 Tax=Ridgeia piscesae TaxID=27915 RepID=A0AAD9KZ28_RIDPI|nr:hypothetical protein NP493_464g02002 [Ridgeia piscesae]